MAKTENTYLIKRSSWSEYVEHFEVKASSVKEAKRKFKSGEREMVHGSYSGGDRDGKVGYPQLLKKGHAK